MASSSFRLCALVLSTALAGLVLAGTLGQARGGEEPTDLVVWVGTYTRGESRGIYRFTLDPVSGKATKPTLAAEAVNPSFLALHPSGRFLYAVGETPEFEGDETGSVSAFAVDGEALQLRLLNQQPSMGAGPCHLVVDEAGRNVLVANYGGGTVAVLPIEEDGRLRAPSSVRQHQGSGPNEARQQGPHAHGLAFDRAGRRVFVADLGADRIFIYDFDVDGGTLEPAPTESVALDPGSGPRHVALHPSGAFLYAINELHSTVTGLRYQAVTGALEPMQTVTTLPPTFEEPSTTAEIALSPDGRFLYASNRGHDSLAIFGVDRDSGRLAPLGHVPTGGQRPRHFAIDPTGRWLLVANQDSDTVILFRRDEESGRLQETGTTVSIPTPVCVLPVPRQG
jgi:6-phosphogluconolactonase